LLLAAAVISSVAAAAAPTPVTRLDRHATLALQAPSAHAAHAGIAATAAGNAQAQGSDLELTLTVTPFAGNPDECGSDTSVDVRIGDQVNICYRLTNNGAQTLTHQSLTDSLDGDLLAWEPI